MTPNQHALARQFVDLDAFFDYGESSNTGWNWTTAARTNDFTEREAPVNYADRGLQYDQEGANRNINVGYATSAERVAANPVSPADPNVLPGARDVAAPDGPGGEEGRGYLWDAALRAGADVRNYGFFGDLTRYDARPAGAQIPLERDPAKAGLKVFYVAKAALMDVTDPYFRGFDQAVPGLLAVQGVGARVRRLRRRAATLPNLTLLRLPHDHTGSFKQGLDGLNSVETELADNDYAVGLIVQKVAQSPLRQGHPDLRRRGRRPGRPRPRRRPPLRRLRRRALRETRRGGLAPLHHGEHAEDHRGGAGPGAHGPQRRPGRADGRRCSITARPTGAIRRRSRRCCAPPSCRCRRPPPPRPPARRPRRARPTIGPGHGRPGLQRRGPARHPVAYNRALWRGLKGAAPYPARRDGRDLTRNRPALLAAAGVGGCG